MLGQILFKLITTDIYAVPLDIISALGVPRVVDLLLRAEYIFRHNDRRWNMRFAVLLVIFVELRKLRVLRDIRRVGRLYALAAYVVKAVVQRVYHHIAPYLVVALTATVNLYRRRAVYEHIALDDKVHTAAQEYRALHLVEYIAPHHSARQAVVVVYTHGAHSDAAADVMDEVALDDFAAHRVVTTAVDRAGVAGLGHYAADLVVGDCDVVAAKEYSRVRAVVYVIPSCRKTYAVQLDRRLVAAIPARDRVDLAVLDRAVGVLERLAAAAPERDAYNLYDRP